MSPEDLDEAVQVSVAALLEVADEDWDRPAAGLTWSARQTAEHVADDLIVYAAQVAGGTVGRYLALAIEIEPDAAPVEQIAVIAAGGEILCAVVRTTPATRRAYHPDGDSDPGGFAAMGAVEILVHTLDIRLGFDRPWPIPPRLAALILTRLFPDVPASDDPARTLLWATGRLDDPHLGRRTSWRWNSSVRVASA